jgi:hypothetical protein
MRELPHDQAVGARRGLTRVFDFGGDVEAGLGGVSGEFGEGGEFGVGGLGVVADLGE